VKIVLAPEAAADLAALVEYLQERNPQAALATADGIFRVIDRLAAREFDGPEYELRSSGERVRSWPVRPYRIYYRHEDDTLTVLRIYHSARRPIVR
jgi:plasmid stabilization system protein ParE